MERLWCGRSFDYTLAEMPEKTLFWVEKNANLAKPEIRTKWFCVGLSVGMQELLLVCNLRDSTDVLCFV